ncbi:MAG: hypothetical protein AABW63_00270 [Nanoarchaeota archaeon]
MVKRGFDWNLVYKIAAAIIILAAILWVITFIWEPKISGNYFTFEACMAYREFCFDADDHCNECYDNSGNRYDCPQSQVDECRRASGDCWTNARNCFKSAFSSAQSSASDLN